MARKNQPSPRNRTITKANELIQQSRFSLSLQQQKIILYLISQISKDDEDFKVYNFSIKEFCRLLAIEDGGNNYHLLREQIKTLADKSLWIRKDDDRESLIRWIEKAEVDKRGGNVEIRLDNDMKPYLLQLKRDFTQYQLLWTLAFTHKYSISLYEVLKSYHYHDDEVRTQDFLFVDLKRLLDAEKYEKYTAFRLKVLDPAVNEINEKSDQQVSYVALKGSKGKAIETIRFFIGSKGTVERLKLESEIEHKFDLNQMTLWDEILEADSKHKERRERWLEE